LNNDGNHESRQGRRKILGENKGFNFMKSMDSQIESMDGKTEWWFTNWSKEVELTFKN